MFFCGLDIFVYTNNTHNRQTRVLYFCQHTFEGTPDFFVFNNLRFLLFLFREFDVLRRFLLLVVEEKDVVVDDWLELENNDEGGTISPDGLDNTVVDDAVVNKLVSGVWGFVCDKMGRVECVLPGYLTEVMIVGSTFTPVFRIALEGNWPYVVWDGAIEYLEGLPVHLQ